jgi:hypothetical protein
LTPARAAPPSPAEDASALARSGDRARLAGHFAEAEASYRASLALVPDDATALSLALCLSAQGKARDSAPLLARLAKASSTLPDEDRRRAAQALGDARRELGTITVQATPPGAAIELDGAPLGVAPLPDALYLDAGKHVLRGSREGRRSARAEIDAVAGQTYVVRLDLPPIPEPPPPPADAPPQPAPDPFAGLLSGTPGIVRGAGLALTIVAAAGGAAALGVAKTNDLTVNAYSSVAKEHGSSSCLGAVGQDARDCLRLAEAIDQRQAAAATGAGLLIGAGAAAALTFLSIFLWPVPRAKTLSARTNLILSPTAGHTGGGLFLEGSW